MRRLFVVTSLLVIGLGPVPASASNTFDTSQVRPNGQICTRVPRGPDEWFSGPPYTIVCRQIGRPAGLPPPVRR